MYRHIKDYEIKYTDVDAFDNLKLSALLTFLEQSACLSADELGFGYDAVSSKNLGFIIANWYVEFFRPVKLDEVLQIHTWPLKPKHLIFLRDYELYCGGEKVGVCSSRWCMVSTKTFQMQPISTFFAEGFFDGYNTERSVEFNSWKIPQIADGELKYSKLVTYSDYDHYFHVNNTKYADFLLDVFSVDEISGKAIKNAQISYVKQCKESEIIEFYKACDGNGYLVEGLVDGELRVQMRVEFNEI